MNFKLFKRLLNTLGLILVIVGVFYLIYNNGKNDNMTIAGICLLAAGVIIIITFALIKLYNKKR